MTNNRLQVVATEGLPPQKSKASRREEAKIKFEKLWSSNPEQFNPLRNIRETERLNRTESLLHKHLDLTGKCVADLGCGYGQLTAKYALKAGHIDAVDIAHQPLQHIVNNLFPNVTAIQDFIPQTKLPDEAYDLVASTELIAFLPHELYRLYFSELSRLVKLDGLILCSTSLDIATEDALERFINLAESEFKIIDWVFSYHTLHIRLDGFFSIPENNIKASKNLEYRNEQLQIRSGFAQTWFRWNSSSYLAPLWIPLKLLFSPFKYLLNKKRSLLWLESTSRFLWSDRGISHVTIIGKRKTLVTPKDTDQVIVERKHRKQVWE